MAITKKELTALKKDFKALEKKMEKLLRAAGSPGQAAKTSKAKAIQKAPTKKTAVKKVAAEKAAVAKPSTKKAAAAGKSGQTTATDQILKIIKRAKKGVDVPTLKKRTGFDDKKVRNIVFRAAKEGRIKKSGRGVYVGA